MTPRERFLCTLKGRRADRVPLDLDGFGCASPEELARIAHPLRRRIAERAIDLTHFTIEVPSGVGMRFLALPSDRFRQRREPLAGGHERVLGTIDTPRGALTYELEVDPDSATNWKVKYPVESLADIDRIASVPWSLPDFGERNRAAGLAAPDPAGGGEQFARRGVLLVRTDSPVVSVAGMMKFEMFLELCLTQRRLIAELTELCRQRLLECLKVVLAAPGVDVVWIGGSEWVTPPMASPDIYDALVQEQERSLIEYVHAHSTAAVHVHCHGRIRHALERTIRRGAEYTEPAEAPPDGDITLAEAKALAAGRITLGGNIEARHLANESPATVERAVRAAFEGGKDRFVLRPTAGPSPAIGEREFRNYMRMIDVWEELSPF